tara:strand:- start:320 stop:493 length:174 start_codon:yes stop_codon:yes gene_type:complete
LRRGRKKEPREYVEMRMKQLMEERTKANDKMTRMWLWKCAEELKWVLQVIDGTKKDK